MLQFASDVLDLETFNQNGHCGFYLGEIRVVLVEMRGYQHTKSLEVDFEIELAEGDSVQDLIARARFNDYRNSCQINSDTKNGIEYSHYELADIDQRVWRVHNFSRFASFSPDQTFPNVRMF